MADVWLKCVFLRNCEEKIIYIYDSWEFDRKYTIFKILVIFICQPNGHIFVDSPSTRYRNSAWKLRRDFIDFDRWIHLETMTSIRRGNFNMDSTFKIDEISIGFPRGFFYTVSMLNRRNFFTRYFLSIIFEHFLLWEPILN